VSRAAARRKVVARLLILAGKRLSQKCNLVFWRENDSLKSVSETTSERKIVEPLYKKFCTNRFCSAMAIDET
jgi:hypothetical protein